MAMPETQPELVTLVNTLNDKDLFRKVIRSWALIEAAFDTQIAGMLVEPIKSISSSPFTHKLNLAIGLGIIPPEFRKPFVALAKIRNDLAHGRREPEDIAPVEFENVAQALMSPPRRSLETLLTRPPTDDNWSAIALSLASGAVTIGGHVARKAREEERDALRRELEAQQGLTPLIRAVLEDDESSHDA